MAVYYRSVCACVCVRACCHPCLQKVCACQVEENKLLAHVLSVLSLLVKYGYYDDPSDVNDVLKPLIAILDGRSDLPFPKENRAKSASTYCSRQKYVPVSYS